MIGEEGLELTSTFGRKMSHFTATDGRIHRLEVDASFSSRNISHSRLFDCQDSQTNILQFKMQGLELLKTPAAGFKLLRSMRDCLAQHGAHVDHRLPNSEVDPVYWTKK